MQIGILGPLEVHDGDRLVPVAGSRLRRLLTRLALDAPTAVSVGALVEAVWPEDEPSDVANALQSLVSRLRRALGKPGLIVQVPAGYRLDIPTDAVDAHAFAALTVTGRRRLRAGDPAGASTALARALELWRGDPLQDADDAEYSVAPATRLEEQRLSALGDRIDAELALGNADEQIPALEELVAAHPLREQFVGQLMRAFAGTGRTAEALAAYQELRDRLGDHLGVDPGADIQALHLKILRGEPVRDTRADPRPDLSVGSAGPPPVRATRTNLRTAVSSFIGRETELARVASLIESGRLTTIVGPGGAGKTRLATEAARPWADRCDDGVWLVELAPVTDEVTIAQAVLSALGLRDSRIIERRADTAFGIGATERVFETLADSDVLLVVDNCEHLIAGVADLVAEVLARCPRVRVLTTSREPLGIAGEALASIPPLGLPPVGATPEQAAGYPAVELLMVRGRAASAGFSLDDDTVGPVVEIVRRLDGLPLAIELAAARLRVLPVAEIAARLGDRFRLLAGGMRTAVARHRTLRAVVEWSWELLTDAERLLAERLSVFAAGATVDAAVAVCGHDGLDPRDVPDLLIALVDKSLLEVDACRGVRYRMLETIREYGVERLDERDELASARSAHAAYYAGLAERLGPELRTPSQLDALAELAAEHDNVLAALRYLGDSGDGPLTLRLILALGWYWNITGAHTEMLTWIDFGLAATEGVTSPDRVKLEASRVLAWLTADEQGDWEQVQDQMTVAADALAAVDDGTDPMVRLLRLILVFFGGRAGEIDQLLEDGRTSSDPWTRAVTLSTHLMFLENRGDVEGMRSEMDEAYQAFHQLGDRWGLANVLTARAGVRSADGDVDGAAADYRQALTYLTELGATEDDVLIQLRLAGLALRRKDVAGARAHIAAARQGVVDRPAGVERSLLADAALANLTLIEGDLAQAVDQAADLRRRVLDLPVATMMFGHLTALASATCALIAAHVGDLAAARDDLLRAYPAGVAAQDSPVLAAVGTGVAGYAGALGQAADGAEILGAAAVLRGYDDSSDATIAFVRGPLLAALGERDFTDAYAAGRSLSRDAAAKRVDPATLDG